MAAPGEILLDDLKDSHSRIMRNYHDMDAQEISEREDAAAAYAGENEKHFVDYLNDCVTASADAYRDIRKIQWDCWKTYKEKEPASFQNKAEWQSRIVVPKPYAAVQFGASAVKKAFTPDFLTITDEKSKLSELFWRKVLLNQLSKKNANLPIKFTNACIMALAIGQSMEMIPTYQSGRGLRIDLIEPWKIQRDPDAPPGDSQGGMYWIHQEWLDYFILKQGEEKGKYFDVARAKDMENEQPDNSFMTKEAIAKRKEQTFNRSEYRTMILASEFWGVVLSPTGEMLLPSATFTVAGGRVIELPKASPYKRLRWPGVSFSPMPDLLVHGGRGLLEGIITIWEAMCNLMCLHEDALKWVVNPPTEINVDGLVDPLDIDDWPGKKFLTRTTPNGNQVVRTVDRRDTTNSILANMQYHDQNFQRGTFVTDAVQGLPGYRKDITAKEAAQNLEQSMGIFGLMGGNLEDGAIDVVSAAKDVIETFAQLTDFADVMDPEVAEVLAQINQFPEMTGAFSISGVQAMMKDVEIIKTITSTLIPLSESPRYAPYIKPYNILKAVERRANLEDEDVIATSEEAQQIDLMMQQAALAENSPPGDPREGGGP